MQKTNNKNLILDEIYLILEFASKGTLFDYIHYKNGLDEPEAFYYFI